MTGSTDERINGILDAIRRARTADKRLQLGESLGDEVSIQIAFDAILHNLYVIGEGVKALPPALLDQHPDVPWSEFAEMRDVIGHNHHRIEPAVIHRTVDVNLGQLETSVKRLRT